MSDAWKLCAAPELSKGSMPIVGGSPKISKIGLPPTMPPGGGRPASASFLTSDGATWLDRELISGDRGTLSAGGFGAEVRQALADHENELIRQGHVRRTSDGGLKSRTDLLGTLRRQEVERVGRELATKHGRAFQAINDGQTVRGTLIGSAQLASGRFAMIDDGLGFSLVPWRPVIENQIGRQIRGVMRGGDISWQLGRARGLGVGL